MPKNAHTGGEGATWRSDDDGYISAVGPKGARIVLGRALAVHQLGARKANARLMAAAPAMLRALRALVKARLTGGGIPHDAWNDAAKAIASATGGEG